MRLGQPSSSLTNLIFYPSPAAPQPLRLLGEEGVHPGRVRRADCPAHGHLSGRTGSPAFRKPGAQGKNLYYYRFTKNPLELAN